jgi:outer membrane immunogenic protein
MKRQLLACLAMAALGCGSAMAADMPVKAAPAPVIAPTWTGTYIGINGGYDWGTTSHTDSLTGLTTGTYGQKGGMVGITYGGNWQSGQWVIGFESDLDWGSINGTFTSATLCGVSGGNTCFTKLKNFSTERLRAGFDFNGWLLFGTAGVGFGRTNAGQNPCVATIFVGGGPSCGEAWRTGWVVGAGIEKMILPHLSAKIEYLHYDFGNAIEYTPVTAVRVLERGDMVRVGINYQFDLLGLVGLH